MSNKLNLTLKVWRQESSDTHGDFVDYSMEGVNPHMSFLELLDVLNERLITEGMDPIAFEHDCREGICGSCAMSINGEAHGPVKSTTACQLHMFHFNDGDTITVEPWRAKSFPVIKDLAVDRSAFDRIIQSGGYVSVNTGSAPDGNAIPIDKETAKERLLEIQKYLFKFQLNKNKSFINKSIDVLVENKLDGQEKLFGRNQYMNSVIFEGNKSLIGKNLNIKIENVNQNSLFGKIEKNNMRAA